FSSFFCYVYCNHRDLHSFPTRRSSDLRFFLARKVESSRMNSKKTAAVRGRPRDFDIDKALDKAMRVFWRKGYLGTSLSDLTKSMGINRPSLYSAFGDKQSLFHKALDHYAD